MFAIKHEIPVRTFGLLALNSFLRPFRMSSPPSSQFTRRWAYESISLRFECCRLAKFAHFGVDRWQFFQDSVTKRVEKNKLNKMIKAIMIVNNQCQARLLKFYTEVVNLCGHQRNSTVVSTFFLHLIPVLVWPACSACGRLFELSALGPKQQLMVASLWLFLFVLAGHFSRGSKPHTVNFDFFFFFYAQDPVTRSKTSVAWSFLSGLLWV